MDLKISKSDTMKQFLINNTEQFTQTLLDEAINVRDRIHKIQTIGNVDLIENAITLAIYTIENEEKKVFDLAETEGVVWAKYKMTLTFKLEWIQAIRRSLWKFIEYYSDSTGKYKESNHLFKLEKAINDLIDKFLNSFFLSYSSYKEEQLEEQKKLVNNLSVPIIPITNTVSILPLIGSIDSNRAGILEEKTLIAIRQKRISVLFIDLSGIVDIYMDSMHMLLNIVDGIVMMGCTPIITGIQPRIVQSIIEFGIHVNQNVETRATLQQALKEHNVFEEEVNVSKPLLENIFDD